jgi:hypothetical protein
MTVNKKQDNFKEDPNTGFSQNILKLFFVSG